MAAGSAKRSGAVARTLEGRDGAVEVGERRHDDHRQPGLAPLDLGQQLDARPSDSIVLALQQKRPILVARKVFDAVEDMSEILERVLRQQASEEETNEGGENPGA